MLEFLFALPANTYLLIPHHDIPNTRRLAARGAD